MPGSLTPKGTGQPDYRQRAAGTTPVSVRAGSVEISGTIQHINAVGTVNYQGTVGYVQQVGTVRRVGTLRYLQAGSIGYIGRVGTVGELNVEAGSLGYIARLGTLHHLEGGNLGTVKRLVGGNLGTLQTLQGGTITRIAKVGTVDVVGTVQYVAEIGTVRRIGTLKYLGTIGRVIRVGSLGPYEPQTYGGPGSKTIGPNVGTVLAINAARKHATIVNSGGTVVFLAVGVAALVNAGLRINAAGGVAQFGGPGGLPLSTQLVSGITPAGSVSLSTNEST